MKIIMGCIKENPESNKHHMGLEQCFKVDIFADEYKVHSKIGEGSFSEVLKCVERQSGVCIAAKQLKKNFRSPAQAEEMPELIALRKLTRHINILHMIESHYDKESGRVTLVFELMDMSLYDMIKTRKKPIQESKAKQYLYQIVKGVDHIHHHGIFHRDIKPENILIKGDIVKIADLGSIKGIYSHQPYTEYISTRWYRSPECLLTSGYYGPKMDVWALGCVFFELLTLKPLFPGSSEVDQIARIHNVLGTPNSRLMAKFKRHKVRNFNANFPPKQGTSLNPLIPFISDGGREILKQMIVYDPETRINIRRLIEHKYFIDMRQKDALTQKQSWCSVGSYPATKTSWRNPVLLSYLTNDKRRKLKAKEGENSDLKLTYSNETNVTITRSPSVRENLGDWKTTTSTLQRLKERLNVNKYEVEPHPPPIGGVGEALPIEERIKELEHSKSKLIKRSRFLPPLLDQSDKKPVVQNKVESVLKLPDLPNVRGSIRLMPNLNEDEKREQSLQKLEPKIKRQGITNNFLGAYRSLKK